MSVGIIGKKLGMTQILDENGNAIPVTVIEAGPCTVTARKTMEKDNYEAVQLGFDVIKKTRNVSKPLQGQFKKNDLSFFKKLKEFKFENAAELEIGSEVTVDLFVEGDMVKVTGRSKGRGFTGTIKRFNTSRGPESHGSRYHRRAGSRGQSADPSKVFKGVVTPGRMGGAQVTFKNLEIVRIDKEKNLLFVKGGVPGFFKSYVLIKK